MKNTELLTLKEKISGWCIMQGKTLVDGPIMDYDEAETKLEQLLNIED